MDYKTMSIKEILKAKAPFWSYQRTDRNGTRYFYDYSCKKCAGRGVIQIYTHIDDGICFDCGGSGRDDKGTVIKVYTAEHEAN